MNNNMENINWNTGITKGRKSLNNDLTIYQSLDNNGNDYYYLGVHTNSVHKLKKIKAIDIGIKQSQVFLRLNNNGALNVVSERKKRAVQISNRGVVVTMLKAIFGKAYDSNNDYKVRCNLLEVDDTIYEIKPVAEIDNSQSEMEWQWL